MKRFINREEHLAFLESEYSKEDSSLVILYGRRRIGKTALIKEFLKNKKGLYFLATEESEEINRALFKDALYGHTENGLIRDAIFDRWEPLFKLFLEDKQSSKKILVIDEFQYIGAHNPAFPSVFQRIWDLYLQDEKIMVILCGSLITMMTSQTLNYSAPLYGRRTGQIKLKQIPFRFYGDFFENENKKDLIEYYSVTGGVPKYIEAFLSFDSLMDGIEQLILTQDSFLYDEPNFLLEKEVSEVGSYFAILRTIASGDQKLGNIASKLSVKQTGLTKYLKNLMDLDILAREVPITEENPAKSKRGLYKIKDNYFNFWFKFIYPEIGRIEIGKEEVVKKKIEENFISNHVSYVYEDICIEEMRVLEGTKRWPFAFNRVGRYWHKSIEIDIVAYDPGGEDMIFGECKYSEKKMGVSVLNDLKEKSKQVEWKKAIRKDWFVLFSISGFTDDLIKLAKCEENIKLLK